MFRSRTGLPIFVATAALSGALGFAPLVALSSPARSDSTTTLSHSPMTLTFGRFGTVTLYHATPTASQVVLFVSGDGGWNLGVVDMARSLAGLDALVVGIDINHYLRQLEASDQHCSYPAADFEALSHFVQKKLDFPHYIHPVLVGYSSGATLVYAALVQSPTTFQGAVSLGFCPDLPTNKPFCRGNGLEWQPGRRGKGVIFQPAEVLSAPWVVLQGDIDQVCDSQATSVYVKKVPNSELLELPKVGHGFSVEKNWMPQFKEGFARLTSRHAASLPTPVEKLKDLPLVEVPAVSGAPATDAMAVHITGDGGYDITDRELAAELAAHGVPTIVLNSLHYFWNRRTPDESARDLERIIRHYQGVWGKDKVTVIGYSMGADVLAFMVNRLPADLREKVREVALIAPSDEVDFEFHFSDWIGDFKRPTSLPTEPEVEKLEGTKVLCFCGKDEKESLCNRLNSQLGRVVLLEGGHRMGSHAVTIADSVLAGLRND